jgi:hypothetical protein
LTNFAKTELELKELLGQDQWASLKDVCDCAEKRERENEIEKNEIGEKEGSISVNGVKALVEEGLAKGKSEDLTRDEASHKQKEEDKSIIMKEVQEKFKIIRIME